MLGPDLPQHFMGPGWEFAGLAARPSNRSAWAIAKIIAADG